MDYTLVALFTCILIVWLITGWQFYMHEEENKSRVADLFAKYVLTPGVMGFIAIIGALYIYR